MRNAGQGFNRRNFLRGSGMTLAGMSLSSLLPSALVDFAFGGGTDTFNAKRLLFINLFGGCDVINTVIPHGDVDYNTTNRPTLFIPRASAIDLNGFASLHPKLQDAMPVYNTGDLAIVHRVGYPNMSLSHFDGYKVWNGGDPTRVQIPDGWLYRYIHTNDVVGGAALPVLTVNGATPGLIGGNDRYVNIANPNNFNYNIPVADRTKYRNAWREQFAQLGGPEPFRPLVSQTGLQLLDVTDKYAGWDQANWNPRDPNTGNYLFPVNDQTNPLDPTGPGGKKFSFNAFSFFLNLKICALSLLEAGNANNGTRLAATELGGFDTHDGQGQVTGAHPELMTWIGYALRSLQIVFSGAALDNRNYPAIWQDVAVVTFSEFGRTSRENGSFGTDHGQATFSLVAGGNVNGGVYNCDNATWEPGAMFSIDGFYLSHRTDYRALFWEILRDHMGANPATVDAVFPGYSAGAYPELNLFGA